MDKQQISSLSQRAIKRLVESEAASLKQESFYLQVLSIKEFDITDTKVESKKTVKLRC